MNASTNPVSRPVLHTRLYAALALAMLAGVPVLASAAEATEPQQIVLPSAPDAQALPPVTAPQQSFVLRGVHFAGNTSIDDATLQKLVAPRIGQSTTLADLQAIADQVTALYRQRGMSFAQALVPVQEVSSGVVEISVVEGHLGKVSLNIDSDVPVSADRIHAVLAPITSATTLNGQQYERSMLLLSDLPGIKVQSALQTGEAQGTTDLTVQVKRGEKFKWSIGLDNFGTREAGQWRLGATMRWNEPFGIGDNFDLHVLGSQHGGTAFGRAAYEVPLGYTGPRLGVGAAHINYSLGGAFAALDAMGTANIYDASLTWPLMRQRNQNFFLRVSADSKDLTDRLRAVGFVSHKRVQDIGIGWAWEKRDNLGGGGYWSSNGTLNFGDLHIKDPTLRAADQGPLGAHTEGGFVKLSARLSRLQALGAKTSLYLVLGAQWTNGALDSSEKLALGGHDAVRAYPTGEALVDQGYIALVELRHEFTKDLTGFVFYDAAHGQDQHSNKALPDPDSQSRRGPGIGIDWARAGNFSLNLSVAWRDTGPSKSGDDDRPRIFVQFNKYF